MRSVDLVAAESLEAAAEYIESEEPIIVVVGDAEVLKPQLEQLRDVVVVDKDGNVLEEER